MATSVHISSDGTFLNVCDICLEDDRHVEAVAFCSVCDQHLCVTCKIVHVRSKASRSHVLVTGDNLKTTVSSSMKILCNKHGPDHEVKYFCLTHEVPCCEKCKLIDHRGCKHIESLRYVAAKRHPKDQGNKLLQKSQYLEAEIESLKAAFETNLIKLEEQQASMVETIHDRRMRLETMLDQWETKSVKALKDTFAKESRVLNDNVSICADIAPEVKTNIKKMQKALTKSDEECLIEIAEMQKDKNNYNDMFREMHKISCRIEMELEMENNEETIKTQLKDSHNIKVRYYKNRSALPSFSTRPYKDRVALDAGEIIVSLKSDVEAPLLSGIEVMHDQDNNILFGDFKNNKLKLFDVGNGSWTETSCVSQSWRMCKSDVTNEIIVTQPDKQCLQLFRINKTGQIMTDKKIKTKQNNVYHINKLGNSYVLGYSDSGWKFDVTSTNGKLIRHIRHESENSELFENTAFQTVDTNAEIMYVSDGKNGCTGISVMTGNVVFKYNDELVKECVGVTTDPDGNVYLSGTESSNVVMLNSEGGTIKVLIGGIDEPRYIKYDELTNTLFVYLKRSQVVKMFNLM